MKIIYVNTVESIMRSGPVPGDVVMTGVKGRNIPGSRTVVDTDPYTGGIVLRPEWCAPRAESDEIEDSKCSPFKLENMTPGMARRTGMCRFCRWNRSRHSMRAADMLHDMCKLYSEWSKAFKITPTTEDDALYSIVEYVQQIKPWRERFNKTVFPWRRMRMVDLALQE